MKHLYVFCEGSSEQGFCKQVLSPHLIAPEFNTCVFTIKIANSREHGKTTRGGVSNYAVIANDIHNQLKAQDGQERFFTTMIDLYALPKSFPEAHCTLNSDNPYPYVTALEKSFFDNISDERFIPYIQLYEYETLLFANPDIFRDFATPESGIERLKGTITQYNELLEHIDDVATTHPKKRIQEAFRAYKESSDGPDIAELIGLPTLRAKCPHFNEWITKLEQL